MSLSSTSANTYRVGDFVYFDDPVATDAPYQIRKIDELIKSEKGVEARCVVYLRRRDIPQHLLKIADQAVRRFDNYYEVDKKKPEGFTTKGYVVANGDGEVKEEEEKMEMDGEDEPPKIEPEEEGAPAAVNQGRRSSVEETTEKKSENPKEEAEKESTKLIDWGDGGLPLGLEKLKPEQRLRLRQHEIFMTRQSEILPASLIRGKCRVVLLGDCEDAEIYLPHEDTFFHSLVYDPTAQTLLADKGAIRVGEKYQAEVEEWMEPEEREKKEQEEKEAKLLAEKVKKEEEEARKEKEAAEDTEGGKEEEAMEVTEKTVETVKSSIDPEVRDVSIWHPYHGLLEKDIDQYLIIARSVGLFARAIDGASAPKLPTLQLAAAFASRDVTVLHAHGILHQANYDVGQAVKYLVPVASREAYPCEIDDAIGLQTKTLGGPILCRDQLEEWSTPEMNLFEDALDKVGKDFSEIRSDYLPWKSVRDIVEYYYLMKASNRYSERKKSKTGVLGSGEDTKLTQVYIPSFNKGIPVSIGSYNTSLNLVRNEVGCLNCGTMDATNWYYWGGAEKKVMCSVCWSKWKRFSGLTEKHELERFDKTRPPVLDQQTSASASNSNGNDKPPVLQAQQQQKTTTILNHQNAQNLIAVARQALQRGQITQEQYNTLSRNFPQFAAADFNPATTTTQSTPVKQQKKSSPPAGKPPVVFYTSICRRAVRRVLPKSAFNIRRLSRKPFSHIDYEAILKAVIIIDKGTMLRSAQLAAGEKASMIGEADFHKGITHLQHVLSQLVTGKRSATQTTHSGEPAAKMARASHYPLPTSVSLTPPTLEDVGNSLLAVNEALKSGRSYVHHPHHQPVARFNTYRNQPSCSSPFRVPSSFPPRLQFHPQNPAPPPPPPSLPQQSVPSVPVKSDAEKVRELMKTRTDSRWFTVGDEIIKFRVGPKLKTKRRELMSHHHIRSIARHPSRVHSFTQTMRPIVNAFFLEPIHL